MPATISHVFTNPQADGTVTNIVRPSDWNSSHAVTLQDIAAIYDGANSVSSGTVRLSNANGVSFGFNGQTLTGSVAVTAPQTGISGIANSETTFTSGTVGLSVVGGNLTIRSTTGNQYQFSASQTVQTQNFVALSATNTLYSSGTVVLTGSNMVTVKSSNAGQIVIIDATQTVQTQAITVDQLSVGVSTGGNTQGNTTVQTGNRLVLVGTNNITLSQATGAGSTTISISGVASQTNQSAIKALGVSNTGSTAGNTGVSTGIDWVIAGTNMVTASESTVGGGPNTIWLNATQTVQTQGGFASMGVSTGGNTAGNTTVNTGSQLVFVGTDNISLSQGTAAGATTISIRDMFSTATSVSSVSSANAVGANNSRFAMEAHIHEGVRRVGISTQGNTLGTTGIFPASNQVWAAVSGITLSQSTDAQSNNTITIIGPGSASRFIANSAALYSSTTTFNMVNTSVSILRFELPENISFSRIDIPMIVSLATSATTNTAAIDMSFVIQLGTRNASTINQLTGMSATSTYTWASNTGAYSSLTGSRVFSFNLATNLSYGEYYLAFQMSSHSGSSIGLSTTALSGTFSPVVGTLPATVAPWADMNAATGATINALLPMQGVNSVSISNTSQTHQASQITVSDTHGVRANFIAALRNN